MLATRWKVISGRDGVEKIVLAQSLITRLTKWAAGSPNWSCAEWFLHARVFSDTATLKLKEYARNVVSIISGDKAKTQIYCQIADLSEELGEADQEKNFIKAEALSQKMDELEKKLGPEFLALTEKLKEVDPNTSDGQEITSIIEGLDESCD